MIEQSAVARVSCSEQSGEWLYANAAMRDAIGLAPDESLDGSSTRCRCSAIPISCAELDGGDPPHDRVHRALGGTVRVRNRLTGRSIEVVADVQSLDDPLRTRNEPPVRGRQPRRQRRQRAGARRSPTSRARLLRRPTRPPSVETGADEVLAGDRNRPRLDRRPVRRRSGHARHDRPRGGCAARGRETGRARAATRTARGSDRAFRSRAASVDRAGRHDAGGRRSGERAGEDGWRRASSSRAAMSHPAAALVPVRSAEGRQRAARRARHRQCTTPNSGGPSHEIDTVEQVAHVLANLLHRQRTDAALRADVERAQRASGSSWCGSASPNGRSSSTRRSLLGGVDSPPGAPRQRCSVPTSSRSSTLDGDEFRVGPAWIAPGAADVVGRPLPG